MAKRERFFRINSWWLLIPVVLSLTKGWIRYGPLFDLLCLVITAVAIGIYYVIWRWLKNRSEHNAGRAH